MARGWESKSVEDQQAQHAESQSDLRQKLTPSELKKRQVADGLTLSRKRIAQQLEDAQNPQLREMLERALSYLDSETARIG
ncbi:MAG: hypothetical protein ACHP8A_10005 [Terriglobales bacterium]|nr:hypothetical protein [Terriglobales bacterium]